MIRGLLIIVNMLFAATCIGVLFQHSDVTKPNDRIAAGLVLVVSVLTIAVLWGDI